MFAPINSLSLSLSWIKVKSASETVYETFHFSLKLLGVLSKQLA